MDLFLSKQNYCLNDLREIQKNYHQHILGDNINTIKKNTEALTGTRKEADLEVHTEKTKYILMSHHPYA
jgi:hypothetical protein